MGFEYSIKDKKEDSLKIIEILEKEWCNIFLSKELGKMFKEENLRESVNIFLSFGVIHGNNGFSFFDANTDVGWHEVIQITVKYENSGKPYIYVLSLFSGDILYIFIETTKRILSEKKIEFEIEEF